MSLHRNDSPARPRRRRLYALAGALALAACASGGGAGNWMKAGASAEEIERDFAECQLAGQTASLGQRAGHIQSQPPPRARRGRQTAAGCRSTIGFHLI